MSEETVVADALEAEGTQSQADTSQNQAQDTQAESDKANNPYEEKIKKTNAENASLRRRLKELEDAQKTREDVELTELQRLQKQTEELSEISINRESAARNLLLKNAVAEHGASLGARSINALAKLIDSDALEFDIDNLTVSGVEEQLKRLKKEEPDLFVSAKTDGGAGGVGRPGTVQTMNDMLRRKAGRG